MRKGYGMEATATMSKSNDYLVLLSGLMGLGLGVLLAKPKKLHEAVFALLSGVFACMVIGPMVAEILTNLSSYSYLVWLRATPDTSLYTGVIGISALLGYQIVLAVKDDLLNWLRSLASKKLKVSDKE